MVGPWPSATLERWPSATFVHWRSATLVERVAQHVALWSAPPSWLARAPAPLCGPWVEARRRNMLRDSYCNTARNRVLRPVAQGGSSPPGPPLFHPHPGTPSVGSPYGPLPQPAGESGEGVWCFRVRERGREAQQRRNVAQPVALSGGSAMTRCEGKPNMFRFVLFSRVGFPAGVLQARPGDRVPHAGCSVFWPACGSGPGLWGRA